MGDETTDREAVEEKVERAIEGRLPDEHQPFTGGGGVVGWDVPVPQGADLEELAGVYARVLRDRREDVEVEVTIEEPDEAILLLTIRNAPEGLREVAERNRERQEQALERIMER